VGKTKELRRKIIRAGKRAMFSGCAPVEKSGGGESPPTFLFVKEKSAPQLLEEFIVELRGQKRNTSEKQKGKQGRGGPFCLLKEKGT